VKVQKKKALKVKKDEKAAQDAAKRAAAAEEAARAKAAAERARQEQLEYAAKLKAYQSRRQERLKAHQAEERRVQAHNTRVEHYLEELSKQQKKMKALRKKHRDVVELQEKVAALKAADKSYKVTSEQQQKLARLEAIVEEIEEATEAEREATATCPGELLPMPVWVEEAEVELPLSMRPAAKTAAGAATAGGASGKEGVLSAIEAVALVRMVTEEEESGGVQGTHGSLQRCPSAESGFSATTALEAPTTMEVNMQHAAQNGASGVGSSAAAVTSTVTIAEVPMNDKRAHVGVDHTAAGAGRPLTLGTGTRSPHCVSPTGSADESQFATPYSFSPLNSSRSSTAEPRRAFWATPSSGAASSAASAGPAARPAWGAAGAATALSSGSSAMDVDNWRVKKPLPAEPVPTLSAPKPAAWGSATAATASSASSAPAWGRGISLPTAPTVTTPAAGTTTGTKVAAGTVPVAVSKTVAGSSVSSQSGKPSPAGVDEWVTMASNKKKVGKK
jgi:hypothetical protein